MNFLPSLGTQLLATMSGEQTNTKAMSDQERLLEPSMFTKNERKQQKEWLQRICCGISSRVPVCTDFFYERFRSRFAFVCIAIQIYFYLVIELPFILPELGFDTMPDCAQTLHFIDNQDDDHTYMYDIPIKLINDIEKYYVLSIFFMPAYLLLSSIALISWNSPVWTVFGAIMSVVNLAYISLSNGQFCTEVNRIIPLVNKDPYGFPFNANGYPLSVIFTYNVLKIALCSIVTLILIILAFSAIKKKIQGVGNLFVPEKNWIQTTTS
jgi:hypothetical protein